MKDILLKVLFTGAGLCSLLLCILDEVDGIGRFALIVFGVIFSIMGSFKKLKS